MKRLSLRALLALSLLLGTPSRFHPAVAAAAAAAEASAPPPSPALPSELPPSKFRDPYVAASPLSAAAVCRDGIALVSLHYPDDLDEPPADDGAPLSAENAASEARDSSSNDGNETADGNNAPIANGTLKDNNSKRQLQLRSLSHKFRDLPLSSRGPLRIEPVHESFDALHSPPPLSLLTAGWRADGLALADAARELMAEEVRLYCLPSLGMDDGAVIDTIEGVGNGGDRGYPRDRLEGKRRGDTQHDAGANDALVVGKRDNLLHDTVGRQPYYGRRIAEGLSYHLAKRAFSEGVRSLSTVGLLACGNGNRRGTGSLYLIDAAGTHRVRAHAIGNGSSALHARMAYTDFGGTESREGLQALLRLIAEEGGLVPRESAGDDESLLRDEQADRDFVSTRPAFVGEGSARQPSGEGQSAGRRWNLPPNAAVELAVLRSGEGRMRRVRLSTLFSDDPR